MFEESYQTMRDIGSDYGVTSHKVGKILTNEGFRDGGRPTTKAFQHNWVKQRFAPDGMNYCWAWHVGNTRTLLESLGYERNTAKGDSEQPAAM